MKECPNCGKEKLKAHIFSAAIASGTAHVLVNGLECMKCENCGQDPVLADQIRRNEDRIAKARKLDDMNYLRAWAMHARPYGV